MKSTRSQEWFFSLPILEALDELGGGEDCGVVLERVHRKVAKHLTREDMEYLKVPLEPKWRNTAKWERNNLVKNGFMEQSKRRGFWEISEAGRKELRKLQELGEIAERAFGDEGPPDSES